jgi:hypothetical protein
MKMLVWLVVCFLLGHVLLGHGVACLLLGLLFWFFFGKK